MKKLIFILILFCSAKNIHAQDTSRRSVNVEKSDNIDPDCETKRNGNILFVNNSKYKIALTLERMTTPGRHEIPLTLDVTVNAGEDNPVMGLSEGAYKCSGFAYDERGEMVHSSGPYYEGSFQIFKCRETKVKIK